MAKGFNLTAEINLRGPSNIRQVVGNIRKQLGSINTNVNVQINQKTAKQISTANKSFLTFNKTLRQTQVLASSTSKSLANLATSAQKLSSSLQSAPQKISQVAQSASQISQNNQQAAQATNALTSEFEEFGRQSALAVRRFAAFATVTGVIYKVSNAVNSAAKDFLSFEKELIKVAQVSRTSIGSLDFLTQNITRLSTGLGVASNDLIGISRTLAQAGLSASDTSKALQALGRSALAPTFDDLNRTVEGSIALMKQFGIGANQLEGALGSINAVAGRFAVEAGDIITAISRAGGVFASASKGVSEGTDALNQFIAVFTSVRATTRESAETIATGLRTIFTRIQRTDTIDSLKAFGITLTDLEGKFVGPYKAIQLLSQGLRTLDPRDLRFGRIVEELGGFRQIGKVIPLIQQFSTAQRALNVAQQGSGSLARDAAIAQQGLANQIQKVQEQFTALIRSIAGSSGFRDLTRAALDISSALISVADAAKSALPALTAIFAIKGFKALTQFSGGFLGGLKRGGGNTLNSGGYVKGYARGGVVPGVGDRDTVPAMLTPGEFVIRKSSVKKLGAGTLAAMNENRFNQKNKSAAAGKVEKEKKTRKNKRLQSAPFKLSATVGQLAAFSGRGSVGPKDATTAVELQAIADSGNRTAKQMIKKAPRSANKKYPVKGTVNNMLLGPEAGEAFGESWLKASLTEMDKGIAQSLKKAKMPAAQTKLAGDPAAKRSIEGYGLESFASSLLGRAKGGKEIFDFKGTSNKNLDKFVTEGAIPNFIDAKRTLLPESAILKKGVLDKDVKIQKAARGGSIAASDTVPALLTPGEFVINKKSAARLGPSKLHSLNKGHRVKGYNKGGYVGGVQKFQSGGEVYDFIDNIEATTPAAERAMDDLLANIIGQIVKQQPNISFDDARIQAENQVGGPVSSSLMRAAETGDQNAAKMVADAQKKQRNVIIKQIRANNKNISISDARAMAEKQIGQQWGGYIKQVKTGAQTQQKINQSGKNLTAAQNKNAQANNKAAATTGSTGGQQDAKAIRNQKFANAGTFLAFGAPMIADQVGSAIGGTTGAGVAGAATGFSTAVSVGSQFGPYGALVGAIAGTVLAVDGYNSAVAQKESEMASIAIDKAVSASEAAMERFSKNTKDASAQQALIANFNKIQQKETEKAAANEKAAQPGMMSSALSFITGGAFGGDRRTQQDISGQAIADNEAGGAAARAIVDKYLSLGKTLDETSAAISAGGGSLDALYAGIVEASPAFQEQAAEINSGNKAQALKTLQINKLKDKMIEEQRATDKATSDEIERARAAKAVSKALSVQSASITRTFNNLNSAVDGASSDLAKASTAIKKIVSGATGFTANLKSVDVLANPSNFSREEQNAAIRQGSQFAGRDSAFMEQMSRFSLDVNDIIAGEAARGQQAGDAPQKVAENTVDAVTKQLEAQFGQTALTEQIRKSLMDAIAKGGDGVDIQKLLEEQIPEFNLGNQALEAAAKSAKFLQEALQFAANGANEYGKLQQSLRDSQATYQNTILQSNIALKQALGERVDVRERISARTQVDATRAGVGANNLNATDLGRRRDNLKIEVDNINDALNKMANDSENTGGRTSKALLSLTKKLADTESSLKATEAAIANLPKSIESNINDIIGEIGRIAQEQQAIQSAGAQFGEQLVGSTPQELAQLSNTFKILDGTLNGNVTTFRQSQAAQQAYFQALRNGSTQQEAFASAQQAFASQTKDALGLFNQLSTMSGLEGPEINTIRATLLEGFAKAQGMGMENSPIFRTIIDNLRADPGESQEIQQLKQALQQQQTSLIAATEGVQQGVLDKQNDILKATSDYFLSKLEQVKLNFNTAQLRGTSLGISRPGDTTGAKNLAKGGVVYASKGAYVNYQPKGTDTVPAMLTPGEFVVNAKASKKNAGLLTAINNSAGTGKTFSSGGVVYAAGGSHNLGPSPGIFAPNQQDLKKSPSGKAMMRLMRRNAKKAGVTFKQYMDDFFKANFTTLNPTTAKEFTRKAVYYTTTEGTKALKTGISFATKALPTAESMKLTPRALKSTGTQFVTNYALQKAGIDDPRVSQGIGLGTDALRQMSSVPQGSSKVFRAGRGLSAAGVNAGFDVLQTGVEFLSDREEFDRKKREQSEKQQGFVESTIDGLIRPADKIVQGAYVASSAYDARQQRIESEASVDANQKRDRGGNWYTRGFGAAGKTYIEEMSSLILEEQKVLQDKALTEQQKNEHLARIKRMKAGLPKVTKADMSYGGINQDIDKLLEERVGQATEDKRKRGIAFEARQKQVRAIVRAHLDKRAEQYGLPKGSTEAEIDEASAQASVNRSRAAGEREKEAIALGLNRYATDEQITAKKSENSLARLKEEKLQADYDKSKQISNDYNNSIKSNMGVVKNITSQLPVDALSDGDQKIYQRYQETQKEIDRIKNSKYSGTAMRSGLFGPVSLTEEEWIKEKNKKLDELYSYREKDIDSLKTNFNKSYKNPEDIAAAKRRYDSGQKQEERRRAREKTQRINQIAEERRRELMSVSKYLNLRVPDKLNSPQAFENFRKNIRQRLDREYGGMASANPDYLRSIGVPDSLLKAAYQPFTPEESSAIYGAMGSGASGLSTGSQTIARALAVSKKRMAEGLEKDPRLQKIIASASDQQRAEIRKSFSKTFVQQANIFGRFNKVASNFQNLNPMQQQAARANLESTLIRQGLFNPSAKPDQNIDRMRAFGATNLAQMIYPDRQTQNKGIRIKNAKKASQGGIIYASEGTLVPYEPRGTDTVPAMLTPGEFVINRKATQKHRPLLESINRSKGGSVSYFEEGGNVTTSMVDGVPVERENPLIKKMDENIAKTTQTMKIATTGRNVSQKGLANLNTFGGQYATDRTTETPVDMNLSSHVTNEHEKTRQLIAGLKLIKDADFADFMLGGVAGGAQFAPGNPIGFAGQQVQPGQPGGMDAGNLLRMLGFSKGGIVYASKGKYVNYEPKGTDTIPAMLTPGEFVVNAKASKQNAALLSAINSGAMNKGGIVYAQDGKYVTRVVMGEGDRFKSFDPHTQIQSNVLEEEVRANATKNTNPYIGNVDAIKDIPTPVTQEAMLDEIRTNYKKHPDNFQPGYYEGVYQEAIDTKAANDAAGDLRYAQRMLLMMIERRESWRNLEAKFPGVLNEVVGGRTIGDIASEQLAELKKVIPDMAIDTRLFKKGTFTEEEVNNARLIKIQQEKKQAVNPFQAFKKGGVVYAERGGRINNTAMSNEQMQGAVQALAAKLAPYASDVGKLQEAASKMFGITSVGTDKQHFEDSPFDAQVIGTNPNQSEIKFRDESNMANQNLVLHEFAHALQNTGRSAGTNNNNITGIQSGIKAKLGPQIKKYYEQGFSGLGFAGGYSNSDMLEQPNELMANMVINPESLSSVGKGLLKGMMKYYGYSKGGIVYARDGFAGQASGNNPGTSGAGNGNQLEEKKQLEDYIRFIQQRNAIIAEINAARMVPRVGRAGYDGMSMLPLTPLQKERMQEKFEAANTKLKKLQMPNNTFLKNLNPIPPQQMFARIQALAKKHGMTLPIAAPFPKVENFQFEDPYGELPSAIGPRGINVKGGKLKPPGPPKPNANPRVYPFSKGGPVYASNGMLIPYRPQGTDTVPAMLTPGEFVVNKTATQQHLPALQAMNQGGRVAYLNNGTPGIGALTELNSAIRPLIDSFKALSQNMTTQGVSTNSSNINVDALGTFTSTLNKLLGRLSNIGQQIPSIPSEITFNMAPIRLQVDITGAEALAALEPGLQDIAATQIQEAINTFKNNSFDIA